MARGAHLSFFAHNSAAAAASRHTICNRKRKFTLRSLYLCCRVVRIMKKQMESSLGGIQYFNGMAH